MTNYRGNHIFLRLEENLLDVFQFCLKLKTLSTTYCMEVWANTHKTKLNALAVLQNELFALFQMLQGYSIQTVSLKNTIY